MAIQNYVPLSAAPGFLKRPIDEHGKLRFLYGKMSAAILGDIGSTIQLGKLPSGAVRFLYSMSSVKCSALGAGVLLNIGYATYRFKQDVAAVNDGMEPASANALAASIDVSAAAIKPLSTTLIKWDFYSLAGVQLIGTTAGAVFPANGTLEWQLAYLYE